MLSKEIYELLKLYEQLDPEEADLEKIKSLITDDLKTNGLIIALLAKIIKLRVNNLINNITASEDEAPSAKKIFKEILKENTDLPEETIEELLLVESLRNKLRKPKQRKIKIVRMTKEELKEFIEGSVKEAVIKDTDYEELAEKVYKEILKGTFKVNTVKDFIALMFAIYIYQIDIKEHRIYISGEINVY